MLHCTQLLEERFPINTKTQVNLGKGRHYPVSNDWLVGEYGGTSFDTPAAIETLCSHSSDSSREKAALLIGESNFLSVLPFLRKIGISTLIFVDIDPLVLLHIQHQIQCIKESDSIEAYSENYLSSKTDQYLVGEIFNHESNVRSKESIRSIQQENAGSYFFLSSSETFETSKAAVDEMDIAILQFDILNQENICQLKQILEENEWELSYLNLTNLATYGKAISQKLFCSVKALTNNRNDCIIQHSHGGYVSLIQTHVTHLSGYKAYLSLTYYIDFDADLPQQHSITAISVFNDQSQKKTTYSSPVCDPPRNALNAKFD